MNSPEIFIRGLVDVITSIINEPTNNIKPVKARIRESNNNIIYSWNIFSETSIPRLMECFIDTIEKKLITIEGEVIKANIKGGSISDRNYKEFDIITGTIFEMYFYEKESFIYLRIYHEKRRPLEENINLTEREWISIDLDFIKKSAWFID